MDLRGLVKNLVHDSSGYLKRAGGPVQVPLLADRLVEPKPDEKPVPMLEALPPLEASFYACESNVISWAGKSRVQVEELEAQYGFYGGTLEEVLKYFSKTDMPEQMWEWDLYRNVKAIAGMSAGVKKDNFTQRKLMMAVPLNFLHSRLQTCPKQNPSPSGFPRAML